MGGISDRQIFNDGAIDSVYNYSGGIPRKINQICDMALFTGFCTGKEIIDIKMIKEISKDLVS